MENLNYGVVGNCKSAALVSENGSVDWMCLPAFNSPSIFAKLIDEKTGGSFEILVDNNYSMKQSYIRKTNILVTQYSNGNDRFEIIDFMPRYIINHAEHYAPPDLIRYVKYKSGIPLFKVLYNPKLEYAKNKTQTIIRKNYIKSYTAKGPYDSVYLYTDLNKNKILGGEDIELKGDAFFLLSYNQKILRQDVDRAYLKLQRTKVYWLNWSERTKIFAIYNKEILRSALVLKLLNYEKSGAIIAALTTSLPETIGKGRNWDYRYCWLRDASMVIKVMTNLGHYNIVRRYLHFIIDIIPDKDEKIQIMYGIDRGKKLTERIIEHLNGYCNSKPVRVGNDAYKQKQNDIYGILMDVLHQQFQIFETSLENIEALWTITRSIVKTVERNWRKPDRGLWEIRSDQKHYTFSKVLCWVAIDRSIKIAHLINMKSYIEKWTRIKDNIKNEILEKSWNTTIKAFTQSYGSKDLDASVLLMEPFGFIDAKDPRYISTVKAAEKNLMKDGLMYRYKNKDDFGIPSSSFTICSFWLINALYKTGNRQKAITLFEQILKYSNHLGLFSEGIEFKTKRLLGNFPQAYSHLALIETAINISEGEITDEEKILNALQ